MTTSHRLVLQQALCLELALTDRMYQFNQEVPITYNRRYIIIRTASDISYTLRLQYAKPAPLAARVDEIFSYILMDSFSVKYFLKSKSGCLGTSVACC